MEDVRTHPLILLVDDDATERFVHRQALEPAGFEIIEAMDGATALDAFVQAMPDIVVLDVMMPQMDGYSVCSAIRATPGGRNIPILMATGLEDVESIEKAYRAGATDFITKPISRPVLPYRIRYMLRAYRLAEAHRLAGIGSLRWRPKSPQIEYSAEVLQIFAIDGSTTRYSARDLLRRVYPTDRAALIRAVRDALDGAEINLDHRILTPKGEIRTVSLRGELMGANGAPRYLQGCYQDITERKRIEIELKTARDEAQTAIAAKTAFLTGMSHELHTPLNAIIGFSELIAEQALGPISPSKYIEFAQNIRAAGQRVRGVFVDVLTMAQLEAERLELQFESTDLGAVAAATLKEFLRTGAAANHQIVLEKSTQRLAIHADQSAVRQMLLRLLSNATKFSAPDSTIRVIVTRADNGCPRVSVADVGIGMTAEEAASAVQPFNQVDDGLARRYEGLGLGLSIVSKLIERHGGRLHIDSSPRKGTQISLDFPALERKRQSRLPHNKWSGLAEVRQTCLDEIARDWQRA
jgi:signal transduction histidine kinase